VRHPASEEKSPLAVVACDIHEEATRFIAKHLNVRAVLSRHAPDDFAVAQDFDVVFALSFFSHMPKATFGPWIKALFAQLRPSGYLIFTTHGLASREHHDDPVIPDDGFWFKPSSEQHDLSTSEYGATIVTPEYVRHEIRQQTGVEASDYRYAYWWEHQDLWIVRKTEAPLLTQGTGTGDSRPAAGTS
jgi:SAM-dependent methyltransferase